MARETPRRRKEEDAEQNAEADLASDPTPAPDPSPAPDPKPEKGPKGPAPVPGVIEPRPPGAG